MHVTVAVPAYTGQIHLGTMRSLFTDLQRLSARGDSWSLNDEAGNALIADCRAKIVAEFYASTSDVLVFVDSDVCWEDGALLRLVDHDVDMVAGIYPQRKDPPTYSVRWQDKKLLWADPKTGLLEVDGVPAGFMKLSRKQVTEMIDKYPSLEFVCTGAPNDIAWALFSDYWIGKAKLGEDYAFCQRWKDMGGKIWVDPEIKMGHVGYKTFNGHLGNHLRNRI